LDTSDSTVKPCGHIDKEVREGEGVGLMAQRKGTRVVSAIIEDDQVILVTTDTENRGGLKVTVYKVKWSDSPGRGTRKRQPNMSTDLTGMTQ
jgi:hypothetical protein